MSEGGVAEPEDTRPVISYTAVEWNTPPTVSPVPDQTIALGTATPDLDFTIGDNQTSADLLDITAATSADWLVSLENIVLGGSGANRTVTVTPSPDRLGSSTITLTVSDGELTSTSEFIISVTGTPEEIWRHEHFDSTTNTGDGADEADPDGDGLSNRFEYVLGSNPNATNAGNPVSIPVDGDLEFSFTAKSATGPGYQGLSRIYDVQTTVDLSQPTSWAGLSGFTNITGADQIVTFVAPVTDPRRFYRLNIKLEAIPAP
jgi:hypothetical protein